MLSESETIYVAFLGYVWIYLAPTPKKHILTGLSIYLELIHTSKGLEALNSHKGSEATATSGGSSWEAFLCSPDCFFWSEAVYGWHVISRKKTRV